MGRKSLKPENRKIKFSIRINPEFYKHILKTEKNKSKYIEDLIFNDLKNKKTI